MVFCICHAACGKSFPDQLIETELVSGHGLLHFYRKSADIGRTDGLMCILDLTVRCFLRLTLTQIILSIGLSNIGNCLCSGFVGDSGGICTQVSDHTDGSLTFDVNSFIKLLSQTHGLGCGEVQYLGSFLLQGTGGKRKRCLLGTLTFFHISYRKFCIFQSCQHLIHLFSGVDLHLFFGGSVKFCCHRLLLTGYLELCVQAPVLFRHKCIDLFFPVCNDPKSCRLYTACA